MKRVIIITLTLGLVLGAGVALAGGHGFGHHRGMKAMGPGGHPGGPEAGMMFRALRRLDLTEAQRTKVQAIMDNVRGQMREHLEAARTIREQLRNMDPGAFDEKTVRELASQLAGHMTEVTVLRQQTRSRIYSVLTPEQQQQLKELHEQRNERRQRMRECLRNGGAPGELPPPPAE